MKTKSGRTLSRVVTSAAVVLGIFAGVPKANAGAFLWISAPNWTYSAAAAASPAGAAYFYAFSVGAGTYSWAYAFSNAPFGSAAAFAEAATGLGGVGAVDVAGIADPYAGVGIDIPLTDPSNPSGFPTSKPGSDPFSNPYTVSASGITFTGSGSELNGVDELQAFEYTGATDMATLEKELGAAASNGSTAAGDVTDIGALAADLGLIPLDGVITDASTLSSLSFTENTTGLNTGNVILVGEGDANSTPEPGAGWLLAAGVAGLLCRRRRRTA